MYDPMFSQYDGGPDQCLDDIDYEPAVGSEGSSIAGGSFTSCPLLDPVSQFDSIEGGCFDSPEASSQWLAQQHFDTLPASNDTLSDVGSACALNEEDSIWSDNSTSNAKANRSGPPYICKKCNIKVGSSVALEHHAVKRACRTYACPVCNATFTRRDTLSRHRKESHTTLGVHICPDCSHGNGPMVFKRKEQLDHHRMRKHAQAGVVVHASCEFNRPCAIRWQDLTLE